MNPNFGLNLTTSSNNRVFNNVFWYNPLQAYDATLNNFWDDGYPTGGNYWSDFDEPIEGAFDNFTGPNQDENGEDGIVDDEYLNISGGAGVLDNYPLMKPGIARTFVYLNSPINNSVVVPGTILDFIVIGEDISYVNYTINAGSNVTLPYPWDINDTVTGGWSDGPYIIHIYVFDNTGNYTVFSFNITIDSVFPQIILNSPNVGDLITPGTDINLTIIDNYLDFVKFTLDGGSNSTVPAPFDIDTSIWADGNRTIMVYAQDMAGNLNFTSFNFTIDGTGPKIILEPPTLNNSVVKPGTFLFFNITDPYLNTSTISYTKNAGPPETFNFTTVYEINTTGWVDNIYIIEVSAQDILGNLNVKSFTFIIDSTPPQITLFDPTNGSVIPAGKDLTFIVVEDNIDWVHLYENEVFTAILTLPYIWNTTNEPDGPYSVRINAQDLAGNFVSVYFNFTIASYPSIFLDSPSNNSLIKAGTLIEFTIIDDNLDHVNYSLNSGVNQTLLDPYDINTSALADGPYWIEVHAIDTAGNENSSMYFFTIDSTPPQINMVSHANNSYILPDVIVFLINDTNLVSVTNSTNGGAFSPASTPLSINTFGWDDGTYNFRIVAADALGSVSDNFFVITIDTTKPIISLISPFNGTSIEIGVPINISIAELNLDYVNYSVNSINQGNLNSPYSIDTNGFPDGNCVVSIYAVDKTGNYDTKSYSFICNDTTQPEITLISPSNITFIPDDTIIQFEIFDLFFRNASYSIDGALFIEFSSPYTIDTSNLSEGVHTLVVRAYDTRDNQNESIYSITKDITYPFINLVTPQNNSVILAGTEIEFVIVDLNLESTEYSVNGGNWIELPSPYTIDTNGWQDNTYSILVRVKDKAGNEINVNYEFIVDSTAPSILLNSPNNGSLLTVDDVIDFSCWDDNLDFVEYSINQGSNITFSDPFDINSTQLSEGDNTIRIFAADLAGNTKEATYTFKLDSISPKVSHIFAAEPFYPYNHTRIIITFSEPMNTQSVEAALTMSSNIQYTLTWYNNGQEVWLDDLQGLEFDNTYTVSFDKDVFDLAGNPLVNFTQYSFIASINIYLDSDEDGMPDGWEFYYGLNPDDPSDGPEDLDGDGYSNLEEFAEGTDPTDSKSFPRKDESSGLELWWLIPILISMLLISVILFVFLLKERKEEPKGPVEEVEDMYLAMRAQQDITTMEEILADKEKLGERIFEAEIMLEKAKEALEKGDFKVITVYEQTLRNLLMEIELMQEGEGEEGKENSTD
jgi:hypothetical protein